MIDERLTDLTRLLDASGARYEILIHDETIASAADGLAHGVASLSELAPTLILETEKGPIAAIISGETRLSYKKVKKHLGLKNVSLATREAVKDKTGADIGYVSLINPGCRPLWIPEWLRLKLSTGAAASLVIRYVFIPRI
jgi:prolyl-tRNA editing enzyme YbaK/EbsC (Cys-tRNA(Pro) deacylase)